MKVRYGLFSYSTENIGDEVQSLAAKRFLPRVDYYFDRDDIDSTKIADTDDEVRIIMNGWFTHRPENWPPKNPKIKPLLIAMHIEQDALNGKVAEAFVNKQSKEFFKKHGPVGARNIPSYDLLKKNGIDTYFSGCVTLTLNPDKNVKRRDFVLAVDVSDDVFAEIKKRTGRTVLRIDTGRSPQFSDEEKFLMAKYWLFVYQSAHCVVTSRLHTMLPCLAFKTPVFAISGRDPKRYAGLIELVRHSTEKEFLENANIFDFENPGENPKDYLEIRKELEKKCASFTGYDSNQSYLGETRIEELYEKTDFIQLFCRGINDSLKALLLEGDIEHLKKLCKAHEKKIKRLESELLKKGDENTNLLREIEHLSNPSIKEASARLKEAVSRKIKKS
ncbi:polysaccharide pyruvyl transferase family protein [Candidatus Saccharibacteria bacterium]|nr:polysaccharide pyruvyl transferase family protein [Candidatus Saccharibacteria bacterium]